MRHTRKNHVVAVLLLREKSRKPDKGCCDQRLERRNRKAYVDGVGHNDEAGY